MSKKIKNYLVSVFTDRILKIGYDSKFGGIPIIKFINTTLADKYLMFRLRKRSEQTRPVEIHTNGKNE